MSTLTGFQFGVKINEKSSRPRHHSKGIPSAPLKKRRFDDESEKYKAPRISTINKRAKHPIIRGERLPINRLIETLNRHSVNNLLADLVKIHPEIVKTIHDIQPKVEVQDAMTIIQSKFDAISENLPYKGDIENDYSYLRIKPFLNEFLNCLSDYILNYLPPIETNFLNSLTFLDFVTNMIIKLPHFTNNEYKYIKTKCYEQVSNTWIIILNNLVEDTASNEEDHENESEEDDIDPEVLFNLMKIINDLGLKQKLQMYNELSENKFERVMNYIDHKCDLFNQNNNVDNGLRDLISVDYSNYSLTANTSN